MADLSRVRARQSADRCIAKLRGRVTEQEHELAAYRAQLGILGPERCEAVYSSPGTSDDDTGAPSEPSGSLEAAVTSTARLWMDALTRSCDYGPIPTTLGSALAPREVRAALAAQHVDLPRQLGYLADAADGYRHTTFDSCERLARAVPVFGESIVKPIMYLSATREEGYGDESGTRGEPPRLFGRSEHTHFGTTHLVRAHAVGQVLHGGNPVCPRYFFC